MQRKWIFFIPLLFLSVGAFAQDDAIGRFFKQYEDDSRFTVVSISPKMFRLMAKVNWDTVSQDLKQTVAKLQSLRILSTETTPEQFYKDFMQRIDPKEYEELLTVRDKGDNVRFLVKETGGVVHELLMISVDKTDFTLMSFIGDIDLDKLSRLSSDFSIQGMDHLKDLKKNH